MQHPLELEIHDRLFAYLAKKISLWLLSGAV